MIKRLGFVVSSGLVLLALLGDTGTSPGAIQSGPLPPPSFRPSTGWLSLTTGSSNSPNTAPQVWAITARSNLAAFAPFDNFGNVSRLSRNAIYLWATTMGRGHPDATFKRAEWPLRLSRFRVDHGWEGQPATNVQQRLLWAAVGGWHLDVRVYYGTQHPSRQLLRATQEELNRLLLPKLG